MLVGQYRHLLDDKSRLMMPTKLRNELSGTLYATYDFDGGLAIFPEDIYKIKVQTMLSLSDFNATHRSMKRTFFGNSFELQIDKLGRIQLPKILLDKFQIHKEVVIIGEYDHLLIFGAEAFDKLLQDDENNFEANSEKEGGYGN